jgi:transcriptional regulator with XRE-family HTH domain
MRGCTAIMVDLADFLREKVDATSLRAVAKYVGVSKTAIDNIVHRRIRKLPKVETLQRIADAYGLSLSSVVEMAGATLGDDDRALRLARELQALPWVAERFNELAVLTESEFNEVMDYLAFRRRQGRPLRNGDQSIP